MVRSAIWGKIARQQQKKLHEASIQIGDPLDGRRRRRTGYINSKLILVQLIDHIICTKLISMVEPLNEVASYPGPFLF